MDDFSQPDWAVMGFQLERSPERRSKVKIEFFGQSDRSITFPACLTHHTHTLRLFSHFKSSSVIGSPLVRPGKPFRFATEIQFHLDAS